MFIHHWQLLIIGLKGSSLCIDFGAFALATKIIASNMSLMEAYYHSKKIELPFKIQGAVV